MRYEKLYRILSRFSVALLFFISFTGKLDEPAKRFLSIMLSSPYRIAVFYSQDPQVFATRGHYRIILFKI